VAAVGCSDALVIENGKSHAVRKVDGYCYTHNRYCYKDKEQMGTIYGPRPGPRFEYACPDIDQGADDSDMVFAEETPLSDMINHPPHYNQCGIEAIDVIEAYAGGNYHRGAALKYLLRADYKGSKLEDLRKAIWYIEREIYRL
jgi:hypothetical protein